MKKTYQAPNTGVTTIQIDSLIAVSFKLNNGTNDKVANTGHSAGQFSRENRGGVGPGLWEDMK